MAPDRRFLPPGLAENAAVRGPADLRRLTGHVGEELVRQYLGAEPWRGSAFQVPPCVATHPLDPSSGYGINPDLWWPAQTALIEVKSGIQGRRYYTTKRQLDSYTWIRTHARSPLRCPRVFYAFVCFKHPTADRKKGSRLPTARAVADRLIDSVQHIIVADLSIVQRWVKEVGHTDHDWITPLSHMLGAWENYYRLTPARVQRLTEEAVQAAAPRLRQDQDGNRQTLTLSRGARAWEGPAPHTPRLLFYEE